MLGHHPSSSKTWNRRHSGLRPAGIGRLLFVLVFLLSLLGGPTPSVNAATPITFTAEELLTRPTNNSITINAIPASAIDLYYEYKVYGDATYLSTSTVTAAAGQPCNVVITGLSADTEYVYHLKYHLPGETDWVTRPEHSFHTQRAAGETFTFVVTSDTHSSMSAPYFSTANYNKTLAKIKAEDPDLWIDTGDTPCLDFMDTLQEYQQGYLGFRNLITSVSGDIPIFKAMGNHEQTMGWNLDDQANTAQTQPVLATNAQKAIFPSPKPDGFYTGNTDASLTYIDGDHLREDYYAWTWGDAQFIVLDPYWYTTTWPQEDSTYPFGGEENASAETRGTRWDWTLGVQQYLWLKDTLANSTATYKFMFIHNVTGGIIPYGRGGTEIAGYFEWGGKNWDDTWGWDTHRPASEGWTVPIHQLMDQYNVTIFFHGHDHFYAKQTLDDIVYQEVPMPGATDGNWGFANEQTSGSYTSQYPSTSRMLYYGGAEKYADAGHLRVTVSPTAGVTVDYVDMDEGTITASYTVPPPSTEPPTCYALTRTSGANGSAPTALPAQTTGCEAGYYAEGQLISLTAHPNSGYQVATWSGTDNDSLKTPTNQVTMPGEAATVNVTYEETPGVGAVELDTVSSGTENGVSSLTFAHTIGTDANRLLLVGVSWAMSGDATQTISSVTFGGAALTEVGYMEGGQNRRDAIYYLTNPTSGAANVVVTFSGAVNAAAGAASFSGVDQTTPLGTAATANGGQDGTTTATVNVTTEVGDLVFDTVAAGQTPTAGAGQTQHWNIPTTTGNVVHSAASTELATGASTTMSWSLASQATWGIIAVPIKPAAGAPPVCYQLTLTSGANGSPATPALANSPGCPTGQYTAGQIITLTAHPNSGYQVDAWSGTDNDTSQALTNQVTMPAGPKTVNVNYKAMPPSAIQFIGNIGSATSTTSGASLSMTTSAAVAAGDDIIIAYATDPNSNVPPITITDPAGNTYHEIGPAINSGQLRTYMFAAYNVKALASASTITIAASASVTARAAVVSVFRGLADEDPLDKTSTGTGSSATPSAGPTSTTTEANELLIGAVGTEGPSGDPAGTWGNSFTAGPRTGTTGGTDDTNITISLGYRIVSATGAYTAAKSDITSRDWAALIATFKSASASPTPTSFNILLGRPTNESVTANIIPDHNAEFYIEYGTATGVYTHQTTTYTATANQVVEFVIGGLAANTRYYYRIVYRRTGTTDWNNAAEHAFITQRAADSSFTFTVTSDNHLGQYGGQTADELDLWEVTLQNIAADHPDFHIDTGDTFPMDPSPLGTGMTDAEGKAAYLYERPYLGAVTHSIPYFQAIGNHENEEGWNFDDYFAAPDQSLALAGMKYRKLYYPNPVPGSFYSGNTDTSYGVIGGDTNHEDYWAWTWGDALFVVIDPYHYSLAWSSEGDTYGGEGQDGEIQGTRWDWSLGSQQYLWLKSVLENSHAKYKFVFTHHVTGGASVPETESVYGRGGQSAAPFFEWGGRNTDGAWAFDVHRPASDGWTLPIHQLMVKNGVSIFFHGHDHDYARELVDGIVYLECPKPDDAGYTWQPYSYGHNEGLYPNAIVELTNSGYFRVNVSPSETKVEYVRSYLPGDGTNGIVADSVTVPGATPTSYRLMVDKTGPGSGTVTSDLTGINCGSTCSAAFTAAANVTLTAAAASGSTFTGWGGDCSGAGACVLTMDSAHVVRANFSAPGTTYSLTVNAGSNGSVTPAGASTRNAGEVVTITATPKSGYHFVNWTGNWGMIAHTTGAATTITMNGNYTIQANFAANTSTSYSLTTRATNGGAVTAPASSPASYTSGTVVTLTASPSAGYHFVNWTGLINTVANTRSASTTVVMNGNYVIQANFAPDSPSNIIVDIARAGADDVALEWQHEAAGVDHYVVYRSLTSPYFTPGADSWLAYLTPSAPPSSATFPDTGADLTVAGNTYFYTVTPQNASWAAIGSSNRTGAFVFGLVPGTAKP